MTTTKQNNQDSVSYVHYCVVTIHITVVICSFFVYFYESSRDPYYLSSFNRGNVFNPGWCAAVAVHHDFALLLLLLLFVAVDTRWRRGR